MNTLAVKEIFGGKCITSHWVDHSGCRLYFGGNTILDLLDVLRTRANVLRFFARAIPVDSVLALRRIIGNRFDSKADFDADIRQRSPREQVNASSSSEACLRALRLTANRQGRSLEAVRLRKLVCLDGCSSWNGSPVRELSNVPNLHVGHTASRIYPSKPHDAWDRFPITIRNGESTRQTKSGAWQPGETGITKYGPASI